MIGKLGKYAFNNLGLYFLETAYIARAFGLCYTLVKYKNTICNI